MPVVVSTLRLTPVVCNAPEWIHGESWIPEESDFYRLLKLPFKTRGYERRALQNGIISSQALVSP